MRRSRHRIYHGAARRPSRPTAFTPSNPLVQAAPAVEPGGPASPARLSSRTGAELAALLDRLWVA